ENEEDGCIGKSGRNCLDDNLIVRLAHDKNIEQIRESQCRKNTYNAIHNKLHDVRLPDLPVLRVEAFGQIDQTHKGCGNSRAESPAPPNGSIGNKIVDNMSEK